MASTPLTAEEIDALEPSFLGPTWMRNPLGAWELPRFTLGWQIAGWCAEYLRAEGGYGADCLARGSRLCRYVDSIQTDSCWTLCATRNNQRCRRRLPNLTAEP